MKLAPAQLHSLNELKMKRCSALTKSAVYKDTVKSKTQVTSIN
ncbi:MAG: hypothetical protein UIL36_06045 [Turicibacter sp.]|nr:hypothetical protein [Turicibacter sp.]